MSWMLGRAPENSSATPATACQPRGITLSSPLPMPPDRNHLHKLQLPHNVTTLQSRGRNARIPTAVKSGSPASSAESQRVCTESESHCLIGTASQPFHHPVGQRHNTHHTREGHGVPVKGTLAMTASISQTHNQSEQTPLGGNFRKAKYP